MCFILFTLKCDTNRDIIRKNENKMLNRFLLERESQDASGKWNDMNVMYLTSSNGILEANIFSECNNISKIQWSIENWYTQHICGAHV